MQQTEITVEVLDSVEKVQALLKDKGFALKEKYILNDYYFSKFDMQELKNFEYKDLIKNSFLIRQVIEDKSKVQLVYKNKIVDKNNVVLSEEKVRCDIADLDKAKKIFDLIGLNNWCNLKQNIFAYSNDKIEFTLQIVEDLGTFIEYEENGSMQNLTEQQKIKVLVNELQNLGLNLGDDYSCKKVYMKFKKDKQK